MQPSDPMIWGETPDDALYVHRLAVRRAFGGQGIGRQMLEWAADQAAAAGRPCLRLDCWAGNEILCCYYAQASFTLLRRVRIGSWDCALFEKRVTIEADE